MPKRKRGKLVIFMPLFAVIVLAVPALSNIIVGATSIPEIAQFVRDSRKDKETQEISKERNSAITIPSQREKGTTTTMQSEQKRSTNTDTEQQVAATKRAPNADTKITLAAAKTVEPAAPGRVDTAAASAQLAVHQSDKVIKPVSYQTAKIDTDQRNELLHTSMMVAGAAAVIYALSYAGVLWRLFYGDSVPARRTITQ